MNKKTNLKVAVCCIACQENAYIREWVEHYKKLGVDKIFLYDNNKSWEANEHFEDVINDYIESGFVEKIDKRDVVFPDFQASNYNACYNEHKDDYDWICFFDCDEFLELKKFDNIKDFLSQDKFKDFQIIKVNWLSYNDNGNIYKTEGGVQERFPVPSDITKEKIIWENRLLKSIVRCGLSLDKMRIGIHTPIPVINGQPLMVNISYPNFREMKQDIESKTKWEYRVCFADGEESFDICFPNCYTPGEPKYDDAVLKHYRTKSCQEYVETKVNRGFQDCSKSILNSGTYFYFNEYSDDKIKYFMTTNCEMPNLLLDTESPELGDMMFTYATAKYATKDIKEYPYNWYWRYNEFQHMKELTRNTNLFKDVKIFPQTALNDIKYEKNCIEYHYVNNYAPYIKYQQIPLDIELGRNLAFIGDFDSPFYFDLDFACKLFKNPEIESEIKKIYKDIDFNQACAIYINEHTDPEDLKKLFRTYKSYVRYFLIYDNFTYAASVIEKVLQELIISDNLSISISWLSEFPTQYSLDVIKMYFVSMCRVNFINFYNTTIWWGAYLNTNDKADILVPIDVNDAHTLLCPIGDKRYKNIKNIVAE